MKKIFITSLRAVVKQSKKTTFGLPRRNFVSPRNDNKSGFTLAEVLITLGIIGIVAAITVPVLMQNIQDKQFKEAAKAAFSKAAQAVQQMKLDNGGTLAGYYSGCGNFKPAFMKYFKYVQDCNSSDCVQSSTSSTIYTSLTGEHANTVNLNMGQFITTDGMFWGIENYTNPPIYITVDVNGYLKAPNVYGKDVFTFQIVNDALLPMGANNTDYSTSTYCNKAVHNSMSGFACMEYVMEGKDY